MICHFNHGPALIFAQEIQPHEDTELPKVIMLGSAMFIYDRLRWNDHANRWEAQYEAVMPLLLPARGGPVIQQ